MERSGPDDARDDWDAQDDGWSGADRPSSDGRNGRDGRDGRDDRQDPSRFGGRGFEMFDDLDDLEDDPDAYPVAPLPRHERTWRHPSEMGEAAWVRTEPPVAIGRGLLVTSGAIGSALGVAVLYLMLPTTAGTPSAGPEATSSFASDRAAIVTLAEEATTSSFVSEPLATLGWTDRPGATLPSPDTPSTVLVMADAEQHTEPVSVAVAIEGSPYMVTTANALASLDVAGGGVHLLGPGSPDDVSPQGAELLSVEGDLAFLSPASGTGGIEVVSFADVGSAEPGEPVTVLADEPSIVPYVSGDAVPELDPGLIVEGTPVVDADGALVALCTVVIDADGAYVDMVPLAPAPSEAGDGEAPTDTSEPESPAPATSIDPSSPDATSPTTAAPGSTSGSGTPAGGGAPTTPGPSTPASGTPGAWIGLRFDGAPASAPLTVTGVVAGSPALAAGVMVGERLVAIDGVAVTTVDEVVAAVRRHLPGDVVRLTLAPRATSSTPTSVAVTATTPTTTAPAGAGTAVTTSTAPVSSSTPTTTTTTTTTTAPTATPNTPAAPTTPAATTPGITPGTASTPPGAGSGSSGQTGTRTVSVVLGALAPTV